GANDSDGILHPTSNMTIDLGNAATGAWDDVRAVPGRGVYDPDLWAVVFHYSSVNIPNNVTVRFQNHPSRAPVVWLVSGDVTISGTVRVDALDAGGTGGHFGEPGPGGFRGGRGNHGLGQLQSAGFGP